MVASYGAVPIPTAPSGEPTATASEDAPAVVEMGAPVRVQLPGSVRAVVTALGPVELTPEPGRRSTPGIITVKIAAQEGALTVNSGDFTSRDDTGAIVPLAAQDKPSATAAAGRSATLVVRGIYTSGAAQLTWRHDGKVVAVWDFNIELD